LGAWLNTQKANYKKKKLSNEKIQALKEFNIPYKEILKKFGLNFFKEKCIELNSFEKEH
jgi:hypothetical protein